MKVLFLIRTLTAGGSERQLALLAAGLARRGHDVAIAVFYSGGVLESLLEDSGVRLLPLGKSTRWHVLAPLAKLWRLMLDEGPAIVCGFLPVQTTLSALMLPPWSRTRLVFRLGVAGLDMSRYDRLSALTARTEAMLARRADLIIANGHAVRADAIARGFPPDRIAVIPNGIDVEAMRPDESAGRDMRRHWGVGDDEFVIGMVARLDPMKDHATFLAAASVFARDHVNARFVCIGDGPAGYRAELVARARSLGLGERVIWANTTTRMRDAFSAFNLASLSSAFGEGFPNVIGEAMACGVPVAATDVGDCARIIGDCGEIVPVREPERLSAAWLKLQRRLTEDPTLRTRARARVVDQFGLDMMVETYEQLFSALCAGRPAPTIASEAA